VYRGFSPPPPESLKEKPEISVNYEYGGRLTDGPLRAEVIGFYNDYQNYTSICTTGCPLDMLDKQTSAGRAQIYGFEALAAHDIPAGPVKVPVSLSYTFTRAQFGRSFTSADLSLGYVKKGDDVPYVPNHTLRAQLGVEHKRAGINGSVSYVSAMREARLGANDRSLKTDAQYLVDASAWAKVWGPFQVYVTGQNLLNSTFLVARRPFGARPNAPRWMHVGLKAAF
jgi:Fe(3+) dicitrate transport protein